MEYRFHLIGFFVLPLWTSCFSQTRVEFSAPLNPIEEGGVCALHCQVWNLEQGHTVEIYRTYETHNKRLSWDEFLGNVDDRWFLATRQLTDGSLVFFLSMTDTTRADKGNYSCKVITTFPSLQEIAADSIHVDVLYSPEDSDPVCSPDFDTPRVIFEGSRTTINCSSEAGNPVVKLRWSKSGKDITDYSATSLSGGRAHSQLTFIASRKDNGVVFLCKIENNYGVDEERTCHVGPFTVLPNPDGPYIEPEDTTDSFIVNPFTSKPVDEDSNPKRTPTSDECLNECSYLSRPVIYWIIGTIFTSIIALTFLIIAAFLFFKLCHISSNNNLDYSLPRKPAGPEELYVEVDCKRDDRCMYMALQRNDMILRHDIK